MNLCLSNPLTHMGRHRPDPHPETVMARLAVDGIVTGRQLRAVGLSDEVVLQRVATGFLTRIKPGIFMLAGATLDGRTALRAALSIGAGATISHWSAAHLDGYTRAGPPDRVHVTLPHRGHLKRSGWHHPHATRRLERREVTVRDGMLRTTVPRTIRDIVDSLPADPQTDREVTRLVEEALQLKTTKLETLERYASWERCPVIGGRLRRLFEVQRGMPDPALLKSLGEQWLRELLIRKGLPMPKFNEVIDGLELDTAWIDRRLNIEFDGFAFRRVRTKHDSDRRRDRALILARWRPARITDTDFDDIQQLEDEVVRLIELPPIPLD